MSKTLSAGLLAVLVLALALVIWRVELDFQLGAFLPAPTDPAQAVLADRLGDSPAARLVIVSLSGLDPEALADASRDLTARLGQIEGIDQVDNTAGIEGLDADSPLVTHRFVLAPDPAGRTGPEAIESALEARLADLGLAGRAGREWVARDPLGLIPELLQDLSPAVAPTEFDGVWFDPDHSQALILVNTGIPGFDVGGQSRVIHAIEASIAATREDYPGLQGLISGPPAISVRTAETTRQDAQRLSVLAGIWVLLLLTLAWRRADLVIAGAIPLVAAVLAGVAMVLFRFDLIHGLTLAFGFTLLGVAMDYPVHLFTHHRGDPRQAARSIAWPLGLGALSTLIAYTAIWISASPGLSQLGAFSAAGLAAAALVTLLILPRLSLSTPAPAPTSVGSVLAGPRAAWVAPLALLLAVGAGVGMGSSLWSDDLSRLSPVDPEELAREQELRGFLGAGEVRYLLAVTGEDLQAVIAATERVDEILREAREEGLLDGWRGIHQLVPSEQTQLNRRQAWPEPDVLAGRLEEARTGTGFRSGAFDPFLEELEQLDALTPLAPESWEGTAFESQARTLLDRHEDQWRSLVMPAGVHDPDALAEWLSERESPGQWLDLQAVSTGMAADYRRDVLTSLGIALALIALLLLARLRSVPGLVQVLLPPLTAVAVTAVTMGTIGGGLTIVQLMALILVAGIGLDYALFMHSVAGHRDAAVRTLWAVVICAASTGGVFGILGLSNIAMLSQLGNTAALGIGLALVLTYLSRRPPAGGESRAGGKRQESVS